MFIQITNNFIYYSKFLNINWTTMTVFTMLIILQPDRTKNLLIFSGLTQVPAELLCSPAVRRCWGRLRTESVADTPARCPAWRLDEEQSGPDCRQHSPANPDISVTLAKDCQHDTLLQEYKWGAAFVKVHRKLITEPVIVTFPDKRHRHWPLAGNANGRKLKWLEQLVIKTADAQPITHLSTNLAPQRIMIVLRWPMP